MRRPLGIVLLDAMENRVIEEVLATVTKKMGVEVDLIGRTDCAAGFDRERGQWRADLVISQCVKRFSLPRRFCIGITGVDLYVPPLNFVFGLAVEGGSLAVVSWHRLRGGGNVFVARLGKEIIHEAGHLEGLGHCPNEACVMWFSNTLSETDRKGLDFCPTCARKRG